MGKGQRFNGVRILLLSLFLFRLPEQTLQGFVTGVLCNAVCLGVCFSLGPVQFAQQVGIARDPRGCVPLCTITCISHLFIPGLPFILCVVNEVMATVNYRCLLR